MWYYETKVGTFSIRHDPNKQGSWLLCIDTVELASYASPELAAEDVYKQSTGWDEWDMLEDVTVPAELDEWVTSKPY